MNTSRRLAIVTSSSIAALAREHPDEIARHTRRAYQLHGEDQTENPNSSFLRFSRLPGNRIIGLPAFLGGEYNVAGLKWVSSWPANTDRGLPRAAAVLVLNDASTGYPFALIEASGLSAYRTTAGAALAAEILHERRTGDRRRASTLGIVGCGAIGRGLVEALLREQWQIEELRVFDLDVNRARAFAGSIEAHVSPGLLTIRICETYRSLASNCDIVALTTTAGVPWVHDADTLRHRPVVLHLSLRDLAPEIILGSNNIVDDIRHVLRENTSVHLAHQATRHHDFISGTLYELMFKEVALDHRKPFIFSPFGLGVLDIALGKWAYDRLTARHEVLYIPDFFQPEV